MQGAKRLGPRFILIASACLLAISWGVFILSNSVSIGNFLARSERSFYQVLLTTCVILPVLGRSLDREFYQNDRIVFIIFGMIFAAHVGIIGLRDWIGWEGMKLVRYEVLPGFYGGLMMIGGWLFREGDKR